MSKFGGLYEMFGVRLGIYIVFIEMNTKNKVTDLDVN
jgi:hypothetical protein